MPVLTNPQLQQLWISNGGNPASAPMAAAIAEAESSGNTGATNQNTNGTTDRGAWQVNSIWGALSTYDPNANAKAAIKISNNGANWGPWSTFTSGRFKQFLTGPKTAPVSGVASTPLNQALTSGTTTTTAGAGGSDLFGAQHSSELLYAAVFVGAIITALWLLGIGLNQSTHGAVSRTVKRAAQAEKAAA